MANKNNTSFDGSQFLDGYSRGCGRQDNLEELRIKRNVTPMQLKLINKKLAFRYCEYKIASNQMKMLQADSTSISNLGIIFHSPVAFTENTLMRIWVDMPDYWARKSRHVPYRHTSAPTYFQILSRVLTCEDIGKRTPKFQIMCEHVNLDKTDEQVLCEYLGIEYIIQSDNEAELRAEE